MDESLLVHALFLVAFSKVTSMVLFNRTIWAAAVAVVVCGCRNKGDYPDTTPVSGTVTYKGQPVEGAAVTLVPQSPSGKAGTALTDAEGNFKVSTFQAHDGAVPGDYTVTVSKMVSSGAVSAEEARQMENAGKTVPEAKVKNELPDKYKDPKKSGLTAKVPESGDLTLTLELTD